MASEDIYKMRHFFTFLLLVIDISVKGKIFAKLSFYCLGTFLRKNMKDFKITISDKI